MTGPPEFTPADKKLIELFRAQMRAEEAERRRASASTYLAIGVAQLILGAILLVFAFGGF